MPRATQKTPKKNHMQRNAPFQLRIRDFLASKGEDKPFAWLRKIGISHGLAHRLISGKQDRVRVHHIGLICERGYCTPNDLFEWHPSSPMIDVPNHPLQKLKPRQLESIQKELEQLSPDKIQEAQDFIKNLANKAEE